MKRTHLAVRCEALDARRLFANMNFHQPEQGHISIYGSNDDELIEVWQVNGNTYVKANDYQFAPVLFPVTGIVVRGFDGDDTINVLVANSIPVTISGDTGNDSISGSNGHDTIYGNDGADYIDGNGGFDDLYGGAGNDAIIGGPGNDELFGGDGNDALKGETGADYMHGEAGIDKVDYSYMTTRIKVDLDNIADDGAASGSISTEFDNVYDDCEWIIAGAGNDTIDASYIVDNGVTLIGGGGNDILAGGAWSDYIDGGTGTDTVIASGGSDLVVNVP